MFFLFPEDWMEGKNIAGKTIPKNAQSVSLKIAQILGLI